VFAPNVPLMGRALPVQLRRARPLPILAALLLASCFPNPDDLRPGDGCTDPSSPACCKPQAAGSCALPNCGCSTGQICYPSTTSMTLACFPTLNYPEGADCTGTGAFSYCATGLGCFGGVCKKYCQTDADCPSVGGVQSCSQTVWSTTHDNISGVLVCDRICDPVTPQTPRSPLRSCPAGFACSIDTSSPGVTFCWKSAGTGTTGATCDPNGDDCAPGYYCGSTSKICFKFCFTNSDCPSITSTSTCQIFSPVYYAGNKAIGACTQ
jgi:hypothetical protein